MEKNKIKQNLKIDPANANGLKSLMESFGGNRGAMIREVLHMMDSCREGTAKAVVDMLHRLDHAERTLQEEQARNVVLTRQAFTDSLTGLFNKAHLEQQLRAACEERRQPHGDYLLMIDLDGFKPINDNYGHAAGDKALQTVADALLSHTRKTDVVARIGGDEFVVLLRGADKDDALLKAKEVEQALLSLTFQWNKDTLPVRGSVGTCAVNPELSAAQILETADRRMYEIKRAKGDTRHHLYVIG